MCNHVWEAKEKRVTPPKHVSYRMKYCECSVCGDITAQDDQRKDNRKQSNYAQNKYTLRLRELGL